MTEQTSLALEPYFIKEELDISDSSHNETAADCSFNLTDLKQTSSAFEPYFIKQELDMSDSSQQTSSAFEPYFIKEELDISDSSQQTSSAFEPYFIKQERAFEPYFIKQELAFEPYFIKQDRAFEPYFIKQERTFEPYFIKQELEVSDISHNETIIDYSIDSTTNLNKNDMNYWNYNIKYHTNFCRENVHTVPIKNECYDIDLDFFKEFDPEEISAHNDSTSDVFNSLLFVPQEYQNDQRLHADFCAQGVDIGLKNAIVLLEKLPASVILKYSKNAVDIVTECDEQILRNFSKRYCSECDELSDNSFESAQNCITCGSKLMMKCLNCSKIFEDLSWIKYHLRSACKRAADNIEPHFVCKYCTFTAQTKGEFESHAKIHRRYNVQLKYGAQFKRYCIKCDKVVINSSLSKTSVCLKCQSTLIFQCLKCKRCLTSYDGARRHVIYYCKSQSYFHCSQCNYKTIKNDEMQKHIESSHQIRKLFYSCDHCNFKTNSKRKLVQHSKSNEIGSEFQQTFCFKCDKRKFSKNCHTTLCNKCKSRLRFRCKICSTECLSRRSFRRHIENNHVEDYQNCSGCNKKFTSLENLKMHKKVCESKTIFQA